MIEQLHNQISVLQVDLILATIGRPLAGRIPMSLESHEHRLTHLHGVAKKADLLRHNLRRLLTSRWKTDRNRRARTFVNLSRHYEPFRLASPRRGVTTTVLYFAGFFFLNV